MGVWRKQGVVVPPTTSDLNGGAATSGTEEPSVIWETGAKIISPTAPGGQVFKMWFSGGIDIYYAESNDGINWTRQATAIFSSIGNPRVFKNSGTYYISVSSPT